jgi:curved DNA-binding protein CbpA
MRFLSINNSAILLVLASNEVDASFRNNRAGSMALDPVMSSFGPNDLRAIQLSKLRRPKEGLKLSAIEAFIADYNQRVARGNDPANGLQGVNDLYDMILFGLLCEVSSNRIDHVEENKCMKIKGGSNEENAAKHDMEDLLIKAHGYARLESKHGDWLTIWGAGGSEHASAALGGGSTHVGANPGMGEFASSAATVGGRSGDAVAHPIERETLYTYLGIPRTAEEAEIKKAYRKKALANHPDKKRGDKQAEEIFKRINEAYNILKDSELRAKYDRVLELSDTIDGLDWLELHRVATELYRMLGQYDDQSLMNIHKQIYEKFNSRLEDITNLTTAVRSGELQKVREILANDRCHTFINSKDSRGETALVLAAQNDGDVRLEMVQSLLDAGANVNLPGESGFTAFLWAALRDDGDLLKLLIEAHADLEAISDGGDTALMIAASNGNTNMINALLAAGAGQTQARGALEFLRKYERQGGVNRAEIIRILEDKDAEARVPV